MIKLENKVTPSAEQWKMAIMGCRNSFNSWEKSDSEITDDGIFIMGYADIMLMKKLCKAGSSHRKFLRMLPVIVDVTAPLYWWKEFDTYKVGTVANSCSTMHKIHAKEFVVDDFSFDHVTHENIIVDDVEYSPNATIIEYIKVLNALREKYLETKDKQYWYTMINMLPSSYNQKRTVMLNYEVLANIYKSRKNHKLDEWREFCKWIETLPFSSLITGEEAFMNEPTRA